MIIYVLTISAGLLIILICACYYRLGRLRERLSFEKDFIKIRVLLEKISMDQESVVQQRNWLLVNAEKDVQEEFIKFYDN